MSGWQVQIHQTTIQSGTGIADNILIVGCDTSGRDHDKTLQWVI